MADEQLKEQAYRLTASNTILIYMVAAQLPANARRKLIENLKPLIPASTDQTASHWPLQAVLKRLEKLPDDKPEPLERQPPAQRPTLWEEWQDKALNRKG